MMNRDQALDNLWLARALFELGAVQFGDFTHGETAVNSPVFINPKLLIGNPTALRVAAKLMDQEVRLAQSLRRSKVQPYDVVAGVPVGGLLLATAYSLESTTPLIYPRLQQQGTGQPGALHAGHTRLADRRPRHRRPQRPGRCALPRITRRGGQGCGGADRSRAGCARAAQARGPQPHQHPQAGCDDESLP